MSLAMSQSSTDLHIISKPNGRATLACLQCRERHIRCNGATPVCGRCRANGKLCNYATSQRGGLDRATLARRRAEKKRAANPPRALSPSSTNGNGVRFDCILNHGLDGGVISEDPVQSFDTSLGMLENHYTVDPKSHQLLDLYYRHFHNAHPFILPQTFFNHRLTTTSPATKRLVLVMQYIGSFYHPASHKDKLRGRVQDELSQGAAGESGYEVQFLLLSAGVLHWCDEWTQARETLDLAIGKALQIGMNRREFAEVHGEGLPVLEESWRRTWWMLYVMDANFAVVRHRKSFWLRDIDSTVDLPCEEAEYQYGTIPAPKSIPQFDCREFADDDAHFSSFAYFIGVARNLGSIMKLSASEERPEVVSEKSDAIWTGWALLIPESKRELVGDDGTVDELLFQAHMGVLAATIFSHRPFFKLGYNPTEVVCRCAPPPPPEQMSFAFQREANLHTAKVLEAIEKQVKLLTLPTSFVLHSPAVICMVAVSVIAHLSACSYVLRGKALVTARDQVRLSIGAIQSFQGIWPLGQRTLSEVKTIAREVLLSPTSNKPSQSDPFPSEDAPDLPDSFSWSSPRFNLDGSSANWNLLEMFSQAEVAPLG